MFKFNFITGPEDAEDKEDTNKLKLGLTEFYFFLFFLNVVSSTKKISL